MLFFNDKMGLLLRYYGIQLAITAVPVIFLAISLAGADFSKSYPYFVAIIYVSTLTGTVVYFYSELREYVSRILKRDDELEEYSGGFSSRLKNFKKSKWNAFIHLALLVLMVYVCFFAFALNTSYWYRTIRGVSGTTINVYGMGKAVVNEDPQNTRLWDAVDIAVPAEEDVVTFITTKRVTVRQTVGNCSESKAIPQAHCTIDANCTLGEIYELGHGITTGNCLNGTCEVHAWCPVEPVEGKDEVTVEELEGVGKYTLHVRNYVFFDVGDGAGVSYNNSIANITCLYDDTQLKSCPIFSLESIVREALNSSKKLSEFPADGGIISVHLEYDCRYGNDTCLPTYSFILLEPNSSGLANYSYTDVNYNGNSKDSRELIEATGLLFLVEVDATLKVFSPIQALASSAAVFVALKGVKPLNNLVVFLIFVCFCCCCCKQRCTGSGQSFHEMRDNETTDEH